MCRDTAHEARARWQLGALPKTTQFAALVLLALATEESLLEVSHLSERLLGFGLQSRFALRRLFFDATQFFSTVLGSPVHEFHCFMVGSVSIFGAPVKTGGML